MALSLAAKYGEGANVKLFPSNEIGELLRDSKLFEVLSEEDEDEMDGSLTNGGKEKALLATEIGGGEILLTLLFMSSSSL